MAIRYDKALNKEINRVIANFNAKVRRIEKSEGNFNIPDTITKKELKESTYTRKELYRKLNNLKSFTKRGAEQTITLSSGINISKYEYMTLKKESARVKRKLTNELRRYETSYPRIFGKLQDVTFAQTGDNAYLTTLAKRRALDKNLTELSSAQIEKYSSLLRQLGENARFREESFKDNYLDMLTKLGYQTGYDEKKLEEIKRRVKNLQGDKFYRLFREDKAVSQITEYYISSKDSSGEIDFEDIKDDVYSLYDNLYESLDAILKDYE